MRNALHQTAVAGERVGVVVDDIVSGTVELRRQRTLGQRHADRVGQTLAERPGRRLDTRRQSVLRVAGGALRIVCSQTHLNKLFELTRLDAVFDLYETLEEALGGVDEEASA